MDIVDEFILARMKALTRQQCQRLQTVISDIEMEQGRNADWAKVDWSSILDVIEGAPTAQEDAIEQFRMICELSSIETLRKLEQEILNMQDDSYLHIELDDELMFASPLVYRDYDGDKRYSHVA